MRRVGYMNRTEKIGKINLTLWIGISLIVAAFTIWLCSIIEIKSNEIMLSTQNLTVEEFWLYDGALQWWKNAYWTVIFPMWGILTLSGITIMISPQLPRFAQKLTARTHRLNVVGKEAVSMRDNIKEEPTAVLQNLLREEATLKEVEKKFVDLREKLQIKVEEDIENKEKNIEKLKVEINDLKFICQELSKLPNSDLVK
jgi:hypothetical protein